MIDGRKFNSAYIALFFIGIGGHLLLLYSIPSMHAFAMLWEGFLLLSGWSLVALLVSHSVHYTRL